MAKDTDLALLAQLLTVDSSNNVTLAANQFTSSSTNTFTVGTAAYFVANGNLGIGNTAPDAKLQVTGTANVTGNVAIGGVTTLSGNLVLGSVGISANGSFGTAGQVLHSNGTASYWAADDNAGGTVTSVATGNGLTGGTITTTGTISVVANTGLVANATGVYVNSTYIGTLSANNTSFLGGTAAASYVQNTDSRTLSGNLVFTGANVFLQSASLGGTATNFVNNFIINTNLGNTSYLRFYHYRHTTGADWTGASTRIQQRIDVTDMGYLEFNPSGYQYGVGVYGSSGSGLVVTQTGNVVTSTNTFTVGTAAYFVSNGNVGIGNTAPNAKLQVTGTANVSGNVVIGGGLTSANLTTTTNTATFGTAIYVGTAGNTSIATSNTTSARLRVDTTGGGGYGRDAPNIWLTNSNDPGIRMMNTSNATLNHSATMYVPGGAGGWVVTCDTNAAFDLSTDTSGNFTARGNVTAYSDERLKKDIVELKDALDKILKLRGVSYTRIDTEEQGIGFIAQELQQHVPEVVRKGLEGYYTVSYGNIVALLTEAIKEQQVQIAKLREEITSLKQG